MALCQCPTHTQYAYIYVCVYEPQHGCTCESLNIFKIASPGCSCFLIMECAVACNSSRRSFATVAWDGSGWLGSSHKAHVPKKKRLNDAYLIIPYHAFWMIHVYYILYICIYAYYGTIQPWKGLNLEDWKGMRALSIFYEFAQFENNHVITISNSSSSNQSNHIMFWMKF